MSESRRGMDMALMRIGARPIQHEAASPLPKRLDADLVEMVKLNDDPRVRELQVKLRSGEIGREEFLEGVRVVLGDLKQR